MFWHNFKYQFIYSIRQKDIIFWLICFPLILGTFFHIAFSNLYEETEIFLSIPVAVVENVENESFNSVMKEMSKGENAMFKAEYMDKEDALTKLKEKDINGIIFVDEEITLTVSENGIKETIIKSFLDQYRVRESLIIDTLNCNPQNLEVVISQMSKEINANENIPLTEGNMDYFIQYFYNLIAMVAVLGSITGLNIAVENQANLSHLGARKCCSPVNKAITLSASMCSSFLVQIICMIFTVTFIAYVLKIDMGEKIPFVYLSAVLGGILGVAFGFFIGSIGRLTNGLKEAVSISISMFSCFISGLMVGNMKSIVNGFCPIINKINPASVISDSFYCLNVYNDYDRYMEKIISMIVITIVFTLGGFLMTRRRKYASL